MTRNNWNVLHVLSTLYHHPPFKCCDYNQINHIESFVIFLTVEMSNLLCKDKEYFLVAIQGGHYDDSQNLFHSQQKIFTVIFLGARMDNSVLEYIRFPKHHNHNNPFLSIKSIHYHSIKTKENLYCNLLLVLDF